MRPTRRRLPDGRRRLPDELRILPGFVRRAGRKWTAEVGVVDTDTLHSFRARAEASGPVVAVRRALDAALDELLKTPLPEESGPPKEGAS